MSERRKERRTRRKVVIVSAVLAVMMFAGVVFAAWTYQGDGYARAKGGQTQALTVLPLDNVTIDALYPGQTGDIAFSVTNPASAPVTLSQVTAGPGAFCTFASGPNSGQPCPAVTQVGSGPISITPVNGDAFTIPAGGTMRYVGTDVVQMSNAADDTYQSADFNISLHVTAA